MAEFAQRRVAASRGTRPALHASGPGHASPRRWCSCSSGSSAARSGCRSGRSPAAIALARRVSGGRDARRRLGHVRLLSIDFAPTHVGELRACCFTVNSPHESQQTPTECRLLQFSYAPWSNSNRVQRGRCREMDRAKPIVTSVFLLVATSIAPSVQAGRVRDQQFIPADLGGSPATVSSVPFAETYHRPPFSHRCDRP